MLRALELFSATSVPTILRDDFFNREAGEDISVALTFDGFSQAEWTRYQARQSFLPSPALGRRNVMEANRTSRLPQRPPIVRIVADSPNGSPALGSVMR